MKSLLQKLILCIRRQSSLPPGIEDWSEWLVGLNPDQVAFLETTSFFAWFANGSVVTWPEDETGALLIVRGQVVVSLSEGNITLGPGMTIRCGPLMPLMETRAISEARLLWINSQLLSDLEPVS